MSQTIEQTEVKKYKVESQFSVVIRRLSRDKKAMLSLYFLIILAFLCIVVPMLSPYKYFTNDLTGTKAPPTAAHWLGTDDMGRDIFTRLLYGGRISLLVALSVVVVECFFGVLFGCFAGYYGGKIDNLIMRVTDVFLCFPFTSICITVIAIFSPMVPPGFSKENWSVMLLIIVMGVLGWPTVARIVRGQILSLREQEFMEACEALGIDDRRRIFKHLLPNTLSSVIVYATLGMASVILTESALSFLGLGVSPPTPTWGEMIQAARNTINLRSRPWYWIPPGLMIFLTVMAFNLLGDGLRDALDPRLKQ